MYLRDQIAALIREDIAAGRLRSGNPVPTERELGERYKVSRPTVHEAIEILMGEGLVYFKPGIGNFVGPPDAPRTERKVPRYKEIAEDLIRQIKAGILKENRPLPSEKHLAQDYGVAVGTARRVVAHLRELGWVITVPQKGTFVVLRENWPTQ